MAQKKVAWKDDSGDNITLTADAWSGTQQVTVQTPENFGKYRALNIVFYSVADATKSATLKVTQEAATATLSPNTVIFDNTETAAKTITLSTNISTLSSTSIALEGADASQFTLSALSALSNGKATFTIKPNSVNQGTSSRNCSIKVTVGRLDVMNIPVEQLADAVVKTEYSNYRLEDLSILYTPKDGTSEEVTTTTLIRAKQGAFGFMGTPKRTKTVTYSSGKVETIDEDVPSSNTIYISVGIQSSTTGLWRLIYSNNLLVSAIKGNRYIIQVPSAEYKLWQGDPATLVWQISDSAISGAPTSSGMRVVTETNKRESYSNFSSITTKPGTLSGDGTGTATVGARAYGTCTYTSEASRTENVPLKFEVTGSCSSWLKINSQTPGTPGTSLSHSSAVVSAMSANPSTTSSRIGGLAVYDALGNKPVTTISVTQSAATSSVYQVTAIGGYMEAGYLTITDYTKEFELEEANRVPASMLAGGTWRLTLHTSRSSAKVSVYAGTSLMWQQQMYDGESEILSYNDMKPAIDKGELDWEFSVVDG